MHTSETWPDEERNLFPSPDIKLRTCGEGISGRVERHVDLAGCTRDEPVHHWRVHGFGSGDGARTADDADVNAHAQPGLHRNSEIALESPLGEIACRTDHVVEPGEQGVAVDISLSKSWQRNDDEKAAKKQTLYVSHTSPRRDDLRSEKRWSKMARGVPRRETSAPLDKPVCKRRG